MKARSAHFSIDKQRRKAHTEYNGWRHAWHNPASKHNEQEGLHSLCVDSISKNNRFKHARQNSTSIETQQLEVCTAQSGFETQPTGRLARCLLRSSIEKEREAIPATSASRSNGGQYERHLPHSSIEDQYVKTRTHLHDPALKRQREASTSLKSIMSQSSRNNQILVITCATGKLSQSFWKIHQHLAMPASLVRLS